MLNVWQPNTVYPGTCGGGGEGGGGGGGGDCGFFSLRLLQLDKQFSCDFASKQMVKCADEYGLYVYVKKL